MHALQVQESFGP